MKLTEKSIEEFINELSSLSPAPGGGSVAALAASLGSGLTSMVCRLTIGKKKYAAVQPEMEEVLKKSELLRTEFIRLIDADTDAFNEVMRAYGLPKENPEQLAARTISIQNASKKATMIPLRVMELCNESLPLIEAVAARGNTNSLSDAGVAALMISSGCLGAKMNVDINLSSITDQEFVTEITEKASSLSAAVEERCRKITERILSQSPR
jgi:formiminotetrahydrofolate cyclodeaminase